MNQTVDWSQYPGMPFAFKFEENFDTNYHAYWYRNYWPLTLYASIAYLIAVFIGHKYMENRDPYKLKMPLTLWSLSLSIFSIMAALRLAPTSIHLISTKGFIGSAIDGSYNNDVRVACWAWLFTISKVPEFLDTFFIVARKQKLIVLHWYHHFLTAPFCALLFSELPSAMIHYQAMNAVIHSMMYSYYTLKAMKVRIPGIISMLITAAQIIQMILGTIWSVTLLVMDLSGRNVNMGKLTLVTAAVMYTSYLVLFVKFFIDSYSQKSPEKSMVSTSKED